MARRKPKILTARVTHLEMHARPARTFPLPTRPRTALLSAQNMQVAFYRYLYEQVGREFHWYMRRVMDDATLDKVSNAETTLIEVLYADGCPAGFFELDLSNKPESVEIAYFGLCRGYRGLGLGKWFLAQAIDRAWGEKPEKVTVHTNTLDHPAALGLYQRLGFEPVAISEETVEAWN